MTAQSTAESMLDLAGYLNTEPIPNPRVFKSREIAKVIIEPITAKELARIYESIATTAQRIANELTAIARGEDEICFSCNYLEPVAVRHLLDDGELVPLCVECAARIGAN